MLIGYSEEMEKLRAIYENVRAVTKPEVLGTQISALTTQAEDPNLWDDPENAQKITSKLSHLQARLNQVAQAGRGLEDLDTLSDLVEESDGEERAELLAEFKDQFEKLQAELGEMEVKTLLNGEYDERSAVVTIRSGVGGVDAADWAEMLLRMYVRWAERHDYPVKIMDTSYAEEAGIKSATFEVDAPYAYGTLSVEAGTHRLVRLSPFDNQSRRQTSFAAVEVIPLIESDDQIEIPDSELKIDVFRSSGPGGQSVNTTDSAVRMTHLPTGIVVSMQNEKSQIQNRAAALKVLQSRLLQLRHEQEHARKKELAGEVKASWGDQMRSYVLHPYKKVKDLRTNFESSQVDSVLDGDLDGFLDAGIRWRRNQDQESPDA